MELSKRLFRLPTSGPVYLSAEAVNNQRGLVHARLDNRPNIRVGERRRFLASIKAIYCPPMYNVPIALQICGENVRKHGTKIIYNYKLR